MVRFVQTTVLKKIKVQQQAVNVRALYSSIHTHTLYDVHYGNADCMSYTAVSQYIL
jgi:hypothetical protein